MRGDSRCADCEKRYIGCHGKDEDGNWRCPHWAQEQAEKLERREKTRQDRLTHAVCASYAAESRARYERKKAVHDRR